MVGHRNYLLSMGPWRIPPKRQLNRNDVWFVVQSTESQDSMEMGNTWHVCLTCINQSPSQTVLGLHCFQNSSLAYLGSLTAKDQVFKLSGRLLLFQ
jgi:hypothetical protein